MKRSVLSAAMVAFYPFISLAASNTSTLTPMPVDESSIPRLELDHFSYLRANKSFFGSDEKESNMSTVGMSWKYETKRTHLDLKAFYSAAEKEPHYNVRELSWSATGPVEWHVGRHRHGWSEADNFWGMGFWEPRFAWDEMRPEANGLSGVFISTPHKTSGWFATLLLSPVYVPELGQSIEEKDGKILSPNPWFRGPPPHVTLEGDQVPLTSKIVRPEVRDVVGKSSVAFQLGHAHTKSWKTYLSYAYKPMNQLMISIEPYIIVSEDGGKHALADFYPEFEYHHIASLETVWDNGRVRITPSVTYDEPIVSDRNLKRVSQMFDRSMQASLTASYRRTEGPHSREFYGGYIYNEGGNAPDVGEFADINTVFEYRARWFEAVKLGARESRPLPRGWGQWSQGLEVTYDFEQEGGTLLSEIGYAPTRNLQLALKVDLIGPLDEGENEHESGFVRTYKANDRFQVGMHYVF